MAQSTTMRVGFLIIACPPEFLPPLPPNINSRKNHNPGQEKQIEPPETDCLGLGERNVAIRRRLGPDGNQVLILREPVNRVVEKVAVTGLADGLIRGEIGV